VGYSVAVRWVEHGDMVSNEGLFPREGLEGVTRGSKCTTEAPMTGFSLKELSMTEFEVCGMSWT
jgi:hypothetical protein